MTETFLDALKDPKRKKVFLKLKCLTNKGVLAGGTALSLQIKHRYSFDFDIFFKEDVVREALRILSSKVGIKEKRVDLSNHITFYTASGVQITLFHYKFLPLYPKIKTLSLPLFNLKDIAADKAYTLGRKPVWRDYVDLFFLLKNKHISLAQIIKDARQKFKGGFAQKLFLEQLTYYQDIRDFKIKFIGKKYSPKEIQGFLKKEVVAYTEKYL